MEHTGSRVVTGSVEKSRIVAATSTEVSGTWYTAAVLSRHCIVVIGVRVEKLGMRVWMSRCEMMVVVMMWVMEVLVVLRSPLRRRYVSDVMRIASHGCRIYQHRSEACFRIDGHRFADSVLLVLAVHPRIGVDVCVKMSVVTTTTTTTSSGGGKKRFWWDSRYQASSCSIISIHH